ncbi:MAG: energy-coupling factor transporter transmembrane component T family protein [Haloferacaceae archaeon]
MTLTYDPGESLGHALDPRTKLAVQAAFAAAAFAHTTPRGLAALSVVALGGLFACRIRVREVAREYAAVLPFLLAAPLLEGARLSRPGFDAAAAVDPALASYRTLLLLALAAAYVKTTPARDASAAVAWLVPGRVGRVLGVGVGLTFRYVPLLQADVARLRDASRARLGDRRPLRERVRQLAVGALNRAFERADRLALALQARCFAWNPTGPNLRFGRADVPALTLAAGLGLAALV